MFSVFFGHIHELNAGAFLRIIQPDDPSARFDRPSLIFQMEAEPKTQARNEIRSEGLRCCECQPAFAEIHHDAAVAVGQLHVVQGYDSAGMLAAIANGGKAREWLLRIRHIAHLSSG
ncbi:MAG TPA: hypothetical protein VMJ13_10900 [Candidatus Acidoferrum sp.]|nr:hypothetical protein [Candidatus Acidoferrum sp.]